MTRINVVPPAMLSNQHLLAEYKEITRPFTKMRKRIEANNLDFVVPPEYCLGAGHETFFFDKLFWLWQRYDALAKELDNRPNIQINWQQKGKISLDLFGYFCGSPYWNDYKPTQDAIYLNMARLVHRHFKDKLHEMA